MSPKHTSCSPLRDSGLRVPPLHRPFQPLHKRPGDASQAPRTWPRLPCPACRECSSTPGTLTSVLPELTQSPSEAVPVARSSLLKPWEAACSGSAEELKLAGLQGVFAGGMALGLMEPP